METILETNEAVLSVRQAFDGTSDQPDPAWIRGDCPICGQPVVSNCYYVGGKGFIVVWECWNSLKETPTCTHRKVL